MRCPFLREAQVKFCQASPYKKFIVRLPDQTARERCSSTEYADCPAARQHQEERPSLTHCPFLHESLVQYCSAASVAKYVPYTESSNSRCGTESHRYCELFLAISGPDTPVREEASRFPIELFYTPNHFWLDAGDDGTLHIGCDAFLASTLGGADRISFLQEKGLCQPGIVLSVGGVDLPFVFPHEVMITGTNTLLRTNPDRLFADPYGRGWLFEGIVPRRRDEGGDGQLADSLIPGATAGKWATEESKRLVEMLQQFASERSGPAIPSLPDGGNAEESLVHLLNRQELLRLHTEFFSPVALWRPTK
jgi:glycine cleavage system H lipoate-binding protein